MASSITVSAHPNIIMQCALKSAEVEAELFMPRGYLAKSAPLVRGITVHMGCTDV